MRNVGHQIQVNDSQPALVITEKNAEEDLWVS